MSKKNVSGTVKKKFPFLKLLKGVALKGGHKKAGTKKKAGNQRWALKGGH